MSGCKELQERFEKREDVYNYTAQMYLGKEAWEGLEKKEKKRLRSSFKTVCLGLLYGLGKQSLATRLNCSVEEAQRLIDVFYSTYPRVKEYIKEQGEYVLNHDGCVNNFFGNKIQPEEWKYYQEATTQKDKKNLAARLSRLGVNLPVQGGTSLAMSSGFMNDFRMAAKEGWQLIPALTVHDSNTSLYPADRLWGLWEFYEKNFTEFVYNNTGMTLLFDLMIGVTYHDVAALKVIDKDTLELTGNARSLLMIIQNMRECPGLIFEINVPEESIIPEYTENPMTRFIAEKACCLFRDTSNYSVQFRKLS